MTPQPDKLRVLESLATIAGQIRRTPSRREFLNSTGIPESSVMRFFPSWNAAVRAAGLEPNNRNKRHEDGELLEDWGRVVRKAGKVPTGLAYYRLAKFSRRTLEHRFGCWSQIREAFRKFAQGKREWADVVALLPPPELKPLPRLAARGGPARPFSSESQKTALSRGKTSPLTKIQRPHLPGRPTYGGPMDFEGFRHEPVNEQGVVLLFGMVARELGYIVESVQSGFPDCEAKRQIAPGRWQRVHLEFEFESRNYREHGHPTAGCDVIVCWRHNWPGHPPQLEILELSSLLPSLCAVPRLN